MTCLSRRSFLRNTTAIFTTAAAAPFAFTNNAIQKPNIILVFIDDMGWDDLSCFGNKNAETPQIDSMAKEGIRFEQFYVNSPICSPSRAAISTGMYPQRYRITSYLNNRKSNQERGVANWLDPNVPMLARFLKNHGYATAHFGKWHMGGQRDVTDAPPITDYGFDESLTNFEGMGAKLLPLTEVPTEDGGVKEGRIWEQAKILGEPVEWMLRSKITGGFVDRAVNFIDQAKTDHKPFYINLWPDDVHSPFYPSINNWAETKPGLYRKVLEEMDMQLGVLFDKIKNDPVLQDNTLILICSDNGPEKGAGTAGDFRGYKAMLYEGGVRSPLIVWGPGFMNNAQYGSINNTSVFSAIDLVPSLLDIANIPMPETAEFDGENLSQILIGQSIKSRSKPIFFRRPPDRKSYYGIDHLPDLAVRDGKWKLLCDFDGSRTELYDLINDPNESKNLAEKFPSLSLRLKQTVLAWNETLPKDAGDPEYAKELN